MKIKNIIFDLGGVIIDLSFQKTFAAFKKLGVNHIDYSTLQNISLNHFEIGKMTASEFRESFAKEVNFQLTEFDFDVAWNAMLLELPKARLDVIRKLKQEYGYKTFLFSNTNEIHLKAIRKQHTFSECFIKEYYSNEFGKRKPDSDAFLSILNENNLKPEETLFLDDSIENIQGANQVGLKTIHINGNVSLLDIFDILEKMKS